MLKQNNDTAIDLVLIERTIELASQNQEFGSWSSTSCIGQPSIVGCRTLRDFLTDSNNPFLKITNGADVGSVSKSDDWDNRYVLKTRL